MEEARHQGQTGPDLKLFWEDLNQDERTVARHISQNGDATLAELTSLMKGPREKAASRVRNALRRLVRAKIVHNRDVGSGVYKQGKRLEWAKNPFERVEAIKPGLEPKAKKAGALFLVALDFEASDSRIARVWPQFSRGYLIPRLRRLKGSNMLRTKSGDVDERRLTHAIALIEGD